MPKGSPCQPLLSFSNNHSDRCEVIPWFWFAFSWWLAMSSISSSIWFFRSLGKCLFRSFAYFFNRIVCFVCLFCFWVVWVLYLFWILTPYHICHLQYLFPFRRLPFHFVDGFLCCTSIFILWSRPICLFLLLPLPEENIWKPNLLACISTCLYY